MGERESASFTNGGEYEHEFVMDTHESMRPGWRGFPTWSTPTTMRSASAPGNGEIVWAFTSVGQFEFACLIPGHCELGMKGPSRSLPPES